MRQNKFIVGLTGSIATGKSLVAADLRKRGFRVIDADKVVHQLMHRGQIAYNRILREFGTGVLGKNRQLDRAKLAALVFPSPRLRRKLEAILHPLVRKEFKRRIHESSSKIFVVDVPLLFESKMNRMCDITVCVTSTKTQQIERLKKRSSMSRKMTLDRIKTQMPQAEKIKLADYVIRNTATKAELRHSLTKLIKIIKNVAGGGFEPPTKGL